MSEIARTGGPKFLEKAGKEYRCWIPLNAAPSPAWLERFNDPSNHTGYCHPGRIQVSGASMTFHSTDGMVPQCVRAIDRFIEETNARVRGVRAAAKDADAATPEEPGVEDPELRSLTEKYRDL